MQPRIAAAAAALFLLASAGPALAQSDPWCRNGAFAEDEGRFGLARVVGAPRTVLHDCVRPAAGCQTSGREPYLVPGDVVLTGRAEGGETCVFFPNAGGGSAGWVRNEEIAPSAAPAAPALAAWAGRWGEEGDDSIRIRVRGATLVVDGAACWPSCNPPAKDYPGGPNIGELDGTATPTGASLQIGADAGPDACRATLTLVGPYLVVADNHNCGGMNVTFSGVYRRKPAPR